MHGPGKPALSVELVYARPEQQLLLTVTVPAGATVEQAIAGSGILQRCPELSLERNPVGIFGRLTPLSAPVRPGDRIEIYRPLRADPKEVRKRRARLAGAG